MTRVAAMTLDVIADRQQVARLVIEEVILDIRKCNGLATTNHERMNALVRTIVGELDQWA